jgi:hypothetical protein
MLGSGHGPDRTESHRPASTGPCTRDAVRYRSGLSPWAAGRCSPWRVHGGYDWFGVANRVNGAERAASRCCFGLVAGCPSASGTGATVPKRK